MHPLFTPDSARIRHEELLREAAAARRVQAARAGEPRVAGLTPRRALRRGILTALLGR